MNDSQIFAITESRFNSSLLINDLKPFRHWLGEWYNEIKLPKLSLIFI